MVVPPGAQQIEGREEGIIRRVARGTWPLAETIQALLANARRKSQQHTDAKLELERLKSEREQLRLDKEKGTLIERQRVEDHAKQWAGVVLTELTAPPLKIGGRDLALRRLAEKQVNEARDRIADALREL